MSQVALSPVAVLDRLSQVSTQRGVPTLAERLASLDRFVRGDLAAFDQELDAFPRGTNLIHKAAHHLLDLRGKHLRPLCVALTSRFGEGFTPAARALALAVELVHSATLLHDDVVDLAERRRGQPTASVVYGNAASIFAGDWLLIAALRKIRASGVEGVLDRMLTVIDDMCIAESVQLERRGKIAGAREDYFAIVEGKTAALFRWAMVAGARAADLPASAEAALERYGLHLGVAFQAVDDELDYREGTGKDALADLREGKITFPLVIALERDPSLQGRLEALLAHDEVDKDQLAAIAAEVRASGALAATRSLAEEHVQRALAVLEELPAGAAREALVTVALASLERMS